MLRALLKPMFEKFGRRYDYSVDYMMTMDEGSPGILTKMALMNPLSNHQKVAPASAYHLAKVVAMQYFDCGPCLRLSCNMAKEAGVENSLLVAALTSPADLPKDLAQLVAYTKAVVSQDHEQLGALQEVMQQRYSPGAMAEISLAIAFGGFYPTMKRALGAATACEPVVAELRADHAAASLA